MIAGLAVQLYRALKTTDENHVFLMTRENRPFWIFVLTILGIWVYLSEIGGYVFQNDDYWARNPIFHDLSTYPWLVYYDLSTQSEIVQLACGNEQIAISYYFAWWLPVCLTAKLFGLSYGIKNFYSISEH